MHAVEETPISQDLSVNRRIGVVARWGAVVVAFFLLAALVQWRSGSFETEFGHWPDAAAHVTNSLLLRDFLDGHIGENPVHFAEQYYIHYPKVSIGMWPPLYYVVAGEWMRVFGTNRAALLLLSALSAALLGLLVAWFATQLRGFWSGVAAGVVALIVPQIVFGYTLFLLDIPVAAMQLVALVWLLRYFETRRWQDGVLFGVLAAAAMFVKGNAMALALLPPLLVVGTRSWWVLRKPGIYLAGLVVLMTAVPWQYFSLKVYSGTALVDPIGLQFVINRFVKLGLYFVLLWEGPGPAVCLTSLAGIASVMVQVRDVVWRRTVAESPRVWVGAGVVCLMISTLVFHSVAPIPGPDERYMTTMYACMLVLCVEGIWWLGSLAAAARWTNVSAERWAAGIAVATLAVFFAFTFSIHRWTHMGFEDVSRLIKKSAVDSKNGKIFILSDADGEGAVVVETAFSDTVRPGRYVMRGSKYMSDNTWSSGEANPNSVYVPKITSRAEVLKMLHDYAVEFVIVDQSRSVWEQDRRILVSALQSDSAHWSVFFDGVPPMADRRLTVYRQDMSNIHTHLPLRVDVNHSIGKTLEDASK